MISRTKKNMPTDQHQELFEEIKVSNFEGDRNFQWRKTQEQGVFTVTAEETKAGVATNVQGSLSGAWPEDTVERMAQVVHQMEGVEKELTTYLRRATATKREDLAAGRSVAPMLSTQGEGHFGFFRTVKGSGQRREALALHTGLVSPVVANTNDHPMTPI